MLHFMRKHAKFFYVFFFIVIVSFVFFYVGPVDRNTAPVLAEVGGERILLDEYWRTYDRLKRFYRERYREKFDEEMEEKLGLKQRALETLLEERMLLRKAEELGLRVTDRELQDNIMNDPTFMRDGVFRREIYLRTLELNRLTPMQYESLVRQSLLYRKMRSLIEESVVLTADEMPLFNDDTQTNRQFFDSLRTSLLADKRQKVVSSYVAALKGSMDVKVNMELIP